MLTKRKMPARRRQILGYVREYYLEHGVPPVVREIQLACGISSTSVVDYNLNQLEGSGHINRRREVSRGIELLDAEGHPVSNAPRVQIVGSIAAGQPLPVFSTEGSAASEEFDTVEISPDLTRRHGMLFALTVNGSSMVDALIDDGDVVVVKPAREASNGDMVVAWLREEEEATLKRFYREGGRVRLQPSNTTMMPVYCAAENVEVRGKVVTVLRKYV